MAEQQKKVEARRNRSKVYWNVPPGYYKTSSGLKSPAPMPPGPKPAQGQDQQKQLTDLQQKEIGLLEQQSKLVAEQLEQQAPPIEKLQGQTAARWNHENGEPPTRDWELGHAR